MNEFDDPDIVAALAGEPTPVPQARVNALRTPKRTSTSITQNVGGQAPVMPTQPLMGAAQTRSTLGQQALGDIASAQAEIDKYTGPQDYTAMQEYAKQRGGEGRSALLLSLAAQAAGKEYEPVGGAYLKRAMELKQPLKTATGFIDESGTHIEDPQARAEQRLKLAQARMARAEQILQSNASAEEKAAAQREALELRREIAQGNQALRAMMIQATQAGKTDKVNANQDRIGARVYDDYFSKTKDQQTIINAAQNLKKVAALGTGASDISLLYQYMKMLDPNSVVRESEFATAARSGSLPQNIQAMASKVINGQRLTPSQRQAMLEAADVSVQNATAYQNGVRADLARQLEHAGIDPMIYLPGYEAPVAAVPQGAVRVKGAPTAAAPVSPDAPPPGAVRVKR